MFAAPQAQCSLESISQSSVTISDFSDEILLHILTYIPSYDLVLNVSRVCRKLQTLCQDKSLISNIQLHKEYRVSTEPPQVCVHRVLHLPQRFIPTSPSSRRHLMKQ